MNDTPKPNKTQYDEWRETLETATNLFDRGAQYDRANFYLNKVIAAALVDIAERANEIAFRIESIDAILNK